MAMYLFASINAYKILYIMYTYDNYVSISLATLPAQNSLKYKILHYLTS
jgi:hypothetical protein